MSDVPGSETPLGPLDFERRENLALLEAMYGEFSSPEAAKLLADQVQLDLEGVNWNLPMPKVWRALLDRAHRSDVLPALLRAVLIDRKRGAAHGALELYIGVPGRPEEEAVVELLGARFWRAAEARVVVSRAGLPLADIHWAQPMVRVWPEIVGLARTAGLLHTLLHAALDHLEPRSQDHMALLDQLDLLGWTERELERLAGLFASCYDAGDAYVLLRTACFDVADVHWGQPMRRVWSDIVRLARRKALLHRLVREIEWQGDKAIANHRYCRELLGAGHGTRPSAKARTPESPPDGPATLEKIFDRSRLVSASFLAEGAMRAAAVVRLRVSGRGMATGLLIAPDLILTARYVLVDLDAAQSVDVDFRYEGHAPEPDTFRGRVETIVSGTLGADGWAIVRTQGVPGSKYPALSLDPHPPSVGDRVSIVQHPGGGPKMVALLDGLIRTIDDQMIGYTSETMAGSGGAPVFDDAWRVVAIHLMSSLVDLPDNAGKEFRQSGLRIEPVLRGLKAAGLL